MVGAFLAVAKGHVRLPRGLVQPEGMSFAIKSESDMENEALWVNLVALLPSAPRLIFKGDTDDQSAFVQLEHTLCVGPI
ncbi:hypothetical protein SAMN05444000_104155 [Shimia gijangensis]|uniref:Uncharacterized protein n=1 Tax=Shimia gijangensis TaxID=1470563 RepID=A0A1M6FT11_9RHOB|nr:hypothetical protein SAMN05444000_104155 [Shimia gijangensis]